MLNNGGWSINLSTLLNDVLIVRVGRYGDYLFQMANLVFVRPKRLVLLECTVKVALKRKTMTVQTF